MSKFSILVLAACACVVSTMKGGMELKTDFPYFVYFITGNKVDAFYSINDTTKYPHTKWLYCMGILFDSLKVLTAESCQVETDGVHWASGSQLDIEQCHPVKSVVRGRHTLDFRIVDVKNSTIGPKWGPLGATEPSLLAKVDEDQLKAAAGNKTMGIVTTMSRPFKIGAMMMIDLKKCTENYQQLLRDFPYSSATLPVLPPRSVFCAVVAPEPFDPFSPQSRFRREDTTTGGPSEDTTEVPPAPGNGTTVAPVTSKPTLAPINTGPVTPGLACPDSLGSPFIIKGGKILGILVAADCHTMNISFFQSLVEDLPSQEDYDLYADHQGTFMPPPDLPTVRRWTPRSPMERGFTFRPAGWEAGAGLRPFSAANRFAPSMLAPLGLICALHFTRPCFP